jgi:pimeloyl-ACP methyl ester carboxylesterase
VDALIGIASLLALVLAIPMLSLLVVAWVGAGRVTHPPRTLTKTAMVDDDHEFEAVSFLARDGLTLRGWFVPARNPKGTIVLCHGYMGDCSPDFTYMPHLCNAGYNTFFFDFRGHGASDGTNSSLVYQERGDLLAALDFLSSRGISRVALLGFSMGGAIALATAPASPMVAGVISDCGFSALSQVIQVAAVARGFPNWIGPLLGWLTVVCASVQLRANLFSADPIRWIGKIAPRPVLIMHGGNDRDVPAFQAR